MKANVHDVTGIGSHKSQQTACRKQSAVPGKPQCGGPTGNPLKSVSKKWLQPWPRTTMCRSPPLRNGGGSTHTTLSFQPRYRLWLCFLIVLVLSHLDWKETVQINKKKKRGGEKERKETNNRDDERWIVDGRIEISNYRLWQLYIGYWACTCVYIYICVHAL